MLLSRPEIEHFSPASITKQLNISHIHIINYHKKDIVFYESKENVDVCWCFEVKNLNWWKIIFGMENEAIWLNITDGISAAASPVPSSRRYIIEKNINWKGMITIQKQFRSFIIHHLTFFLVWLLHPINS